MAIKEIQAKDMDEFNDYSREIMIMCKLNHKNIMPILDHHFEIDFTDRGKIIYTIYYVMEYAE